jgi:hypothetical protein
MSTETISQVVDRFTAKGYTGQFRVEPGGFRWVGGLIYRPEELVVDEIVRIEGTSSPDEESMVLALRHPSSGSRGTYAVAFGKEMAALEMEMVQRLHLKSGADRQPSLA